MQECKPATIEKNCGLKNISDCGIEEPLFQSEIRNPKSAIRILTWYWKGFPDENDLNEVLEDFGLEALEVDSEDNEYCFFAIGKRPISKQAAKRALQDWEIDKYGEDTEED